MRVNKTDQAFKAVAYKNPLLRLTVKDLKYTKLIKERKDVKPKRGDITLREWFENETYPDIKKIRVQSLRKLIMLLFYLKEGLKEQNPTISGELIMLQVRDLNIQDIDDSIFKELNLSRRSGYDYLKTLQMILDYSCY